VSGPILQLRPDLEQLDANIADENHRGIASGLKCVLPLCQQACPERLTRLKQHLYVKLDMLDLVDRTVVQALRPFPRPDAYFWRLFARDVELCGDFAFACFVWNHFRMNAVKESLYSAGSPEDGFICLHMARQLRRLDPEELLERQEEHRYDPPDLQDYFRVDVFARTRADDGCAAGEIRATDYLHPDRLYRLACQQWPDPSAFQEWLEYGQLTEMSPAELEEMAGIWAQALPQDHRPWMALAHAAEERNAYNKALKYIGKAEQVARLDPIPRQARLRLLIAKTLRHFREEKLNLVPRDLDELRALAQAREGDRPAFVDALAWLHAVMTREMARAAESAARIEDRLGGALPGTLLRVSVAQAAACRDDRLRTLRKSLTGRKNSQLIQALIRVHPIGIDLDIEIPLPSAWEKRLTQWLKRSPCDLALTQLAILAEAALTACWDELAYCCTHHGLRSDGTHLAAFLLLRARSLPFTVEGRRQACLDVALELARRHRQMDLVAKIVNTKRTLSTLSWSPFDDGIRFDVDCDLEEEDLEDCLREERDAKQYPRPSLPARAGFARFGSRVLPGDRTKSGCGTQRGGGNHSGSQDHQMYLFDGFKEEDSDQEEGFDLAEPGPVLSLPRELVDALEALERNEPAAASELARLIVKYPKVGGKLAEAMAKNLGERR